MIKEKQVIKIGDLMVLARRGHEINVGNGFWSVPKEERDIDQDMALMIGELYESLEAHRRNRYADIEAFQEIVARAFARHGLTDYQKDNAWKELFEARIKDTIEDELADTIIRCMDMLIGYDLADSIVFVRRAFEEEKSYGGWVKKKDKEFLMLCDEAPEKALKDMIDHIITFCIFNDIDICWHIEQKIEYNRLRSGKGGKHGKAY